MVKTIRRFGALLCVCAIVAMAMTGCTVNINVADSSTDPSSQSKSSATPSDTADTTVTNETPGNTETQPTETVLVLEQQLREIMKDGRDFQPMDVSAYLLPDTVTTVYKTGNDAGYVIKLAVTGYGPNMVIMCGVSADGTVTGTTCVSSNEALGKEKEYGNNFVGKDAAGVDAVDIISGATCTTRAYKNAVKDAIHTALILMGDSVDLRAIPQDTVSILEGGDTGC